MKIDFCHNSQGLRKEQIELSKLGVWGSKKELLTGVGSIEGPPRNREAQGLPVPSQVSLFPLCDLL